MASRLGQIGSGAGAGPGDAVRVPAPAAARAALRAVRFLERLSVDCPPLPGWPAEFLRREARAQEGRDAGSILYTAALESLAAMLEGEPACVVAEPRRRPSGVAAGGGCPEPAR